RTRCRFYGDKLEVLARLLFQEAPYSRDRAPRTDSHDERGNLSPDLFPDLASSSFKMRLGILRVFELARLKSALGGACNLGGAFNGARHTLLRWSKLDLRSVSLQNVAALHAHVLRHH